MHSEFTRDLLVIFQSRGHPFVDVTTFESEGYDVRGDNFLASLQTLYNEELITSQNDADLGFEVGACGSVQWSIIDLQITKKGILYLTHSSTTKTAKFLKFTEHRVISALIVAAVIALVGLGVAYYKNPQGEAKPASSESSTPTKSSNLDGDKAAADP